MPGLIAVSGATKLRQTPASVIYFVVMATKADKTNKNAKNTKINDAEWKDIDLAQTLAQAVIAAPSIGVLDCISTNHADRVKGIMFLAFLIRGYLITVNKAKKR